MKKLGLLLVAVAMLFNVSTTSVLAAESKAQNNKVQVLGIANEQALNVELDYDTMTLNATGKGTYTHYGFGTQEYFRVEIKSSNGFVMFSEGVQGNDNTLQIAKKLNGFYIEEGDMITVFHREAGNRLRVFGPVVGAPKDLSTGMGATTPNTYEKVVSFKVGSGNLEYIAR